MKSEVLNLTDSQLTTLSLEVRKSVFEICANANSGHIGGCSGAVELLVTLYFGGFLVYTRGVRPNVVKDRVLVRGHLGPLRYKIFSLLGYLEESELSGYRKYGTRLHGHEDHLETPGVDITPSGSLGMLLSYGVGSAIAAKQSVLDHTTYVFLGDGEEQEGNVSEAARHAAHLRLDNLIAIIDLNSKQLSNPTSEIDSSDLQRIWSGYGWNTIVLDTGHDIATIRRAYQSAKDMLLSAKGPVVILAKTEKGKGLEGHLLHFSGYHTTSTCEPELIASSIQEMSGELIPFRAELDVVKGKIRSFVEEHDLCAPRQQTQFNPVDLRIEPLESTPHNPDACQFDYFHILGDVISQGSVEVSPMYFLTADVTRKDHVAQLGLERFCTFMNVGIREQHSIAMAHGLSLTQPESRILVNTFDAFTYRSLDQLNATVQGRGNVIIIGDVAGLTNSRNGRTHQTSGQPGALLMMPGITLLEPWDTVDTFNCLNWAIGKSRGVVFVRIYNYRVTPDIQMTAERNINSYVVRYGGDNPDITIVGSGLTVNSAIEAAVVLESEGVAVRVINVINHKGLDSSFARMIPSGKPLITTYNGNSHVLQSNVARVILERGSNIPSKLTGLGFDFGTTGGTSDLLKAYGLDADGLIRKVRQELQ